jgi:shikimate dehydrogenase
MRRFGIIGYPLAHSFSRRYFSEFFIREGIDACYDNFELNSLEYFSRVLDSHPDLVGLNVTIPFKQAIIPI